MKRRWTRPIRLSFCRYWNLRIDQQIVHGIVKDKGQRFPRQVSESRIQKLRGQYQQFVIQVPERTQNTS
jgi:hypothetical protein